MFSDEPAIRRFWCAGWYSWGHRFGLIAPTFGSTNRLINATCAPVAAVLSAIAIQLLAQGAPPVTVMLMMTVRGILTKLIQILIGFPGIGKLIKYIPYPLLSGYLCGVGLITAIAHINVMRRMGSS